MFKIFWAVSFIFTTIFKHPMIFIDMGIIGDIDIIIFFLQAFFLLKVYFVK